VIRQRDGIFEFQVADGWREMIDPLGPATDAQLKRLNREGRLAIVSNGERITKGDAALEMDRVRRGIK
jgi:hypothetical protein